jgi:hypothetical protein
VATRLDTAGKYPYKFIPPVLLEFRFPVFMLPTVEYLLQIFTKNARGDKVISHELEQGNSQSLISESTATKKPPS